MAKRPPLQHEPLTRERVLEALRKTGGSAQKRDIARELGIGDISISPWCSAEDRERFYSHRASGGRDGRMVAYLGRPRANG